jgi:hypothetical protein
MLEVVRQLRVVGWWRVRSGEDVAAGVGDADLFLWAADLGEGRDDAAGAEDVA